MRAIYPPARRLTGGFTNLPERKTPTIVDFIGIGVVQRVSVKNFDDFTTNTTLFSVYQNRIPAISMGYSDTPLWPIDCMVNVEQAGFGGKS